MRIKLLLLLPFLVFLLAGCGGATGILNPFTGSYSSEPWSQTSPAHSGTITFNISAIGTVSGSMHDSGTAITYAISGLIDTNGNLNATITPSGGPASTITGTLFLNGGLLSGNLSDSGGPYNTILVN